MKEIMENCLKTIKAFSRKARRLKRNGDEWARTTDSRIFSPMLYQLSYITVMGYKTR